MNQNCKFIDVCAGIGSAHLAFKNLGCECIGYSEIDKKSESVYKVLHGNNYKNYGDLMLINPNELQNFDILLAGFPCQAFSIVGKRKGFKDKRGQIIYGISKIIKAKQPKSFLLENVKGLLSINNGETLKEILLLLEKIGYKVFYKVLESFSFGVPQARKRIYFVGIRNDIFNDNFSFPKGLNKKINLKSFLIDNDSNLILKNSPYKTFLKYLDNKYNKGKYILNDLLNQDYLVLDTRQSDLRLYNNKIPTLRTGRQGILYIKNQAIRKLSGLEALLLQGFDLDKARLVQENFGQTSILSQAGNAMTVNVMQAIGNNILKYIS